MNGRPAQQVQYDFPNTSHVHWVVTKPITDTLLANGITFILRKGPRGVNLSPTWYSSSVQAGAFEAKFTNDGVFVKDGDFAVGASIDLIIKGLPAGIHNLTTFHNVTDNIIPANACPIDVYVDNVLKINDLVPSIRLEKITEVSTSDLQITAVDGQDVVISYRAETSGSQPVKNMYINGIYLNVVNVGKKARAIDPVSQNQYLDVSNGSGYTLKWESSPSAISHDIYFGTDSLGVANANRNSSFYKGNQTKLDTTFAVGNLYSMDSYYWRIDEVSTDQTYKGDVWLFRTRQLAFSGAEGFGQFARGGRGGKVVYVTNLNDSGAGSLREAVTNNIGPRTIVFNVGGVIQLQSRLVLSNRYVTIAGQTAPGKGICIRKSPFGIGADDAIVRFVRLRLGSGPTADGMGMNGNNSIMDHCSISWTIDEAFSSRGAKNITLQNTLISEALNIAGHQNYPAGAQHGYAATIGGKKGSFHHNLLAHNYGRNWSLGGGLNPGGFFDGQLDIRNNVVYNWGNRATDGGSYEVNFVNNYYKPGAGTTLFFALTAQYENVRQGTQRYYFEGNVMPGRFNESNQSAGKRVTLSNGQPALTYDPWVNTPFFDAPVTTQTAYHGYKMVLSDVGVNQPVLDLHDTRMVNETLNGTYTVTGSISGKKGFPDSETDAGGFELYPTVARLPNWDTDIDGLPDWWENIKGTSPNSAPGDFSDANQDIDRDGVTNLDEYLQWMAEPHYQSVAGEKVNIDISQLSKGFSITPAYTVSNIVNGSATVNNGIVEFTPLANGLAAFDFTVTDGQGHSMTKKVNVVKGVDLTLLPVTLTEFSAQRENKKEVSVNWKTVQENNNSHFEILRSDDGKSFINLGVKINSKGLGGNSKAVLNYDFLDNNSNIQDTYYQLLQVDKDGAKSFSDIKLAKGNETEFSVWPIPSNGDVFIAVGELKEPANLNVYDVSGKLISQQALSSNQTHKIALQNKGLFILRAKSIKTGNDLFVKKIILE
ncbi:T9SS type A sorting domain-containing protein [Pedobacter alpinus]